MVDLVNVSLAICASEHEVWAVDDDVLVEAQGPPELLTLEPDRVVVGLDGIVVGDDEDAPLLQSMQLTIERFDEAIAHV